MKDFNGAPLAAFAIGIFMTYMAMLLSAPVPFANGQPLGEQNFPGQEL